MDHLKELIKLAEKDFEGCKTLTELDNAKSKYIYKKQISKNIYEKTLVLPSNTNLSLNDSEETIKVYENLKNILKTIKN